MVATDNKMHFHQYRKGKFHTSFIKKNLFLYPKTSENGCFGIKINTLSCSCFKFDIFLAEILEHTGTDDSGLPYVMHLLTLEEIEGLPPGGGLSAK